MADQLERALGETDLSVRELARRMAEADGKDWDAKRRWLIKVQRGQIKRPTRKSLANLARGLNLPGDYFKTPQLARLTLEDELAAIRAQVEALEGQMAAVQEALQGRGPGEDPRRSA